MTLLQQAMRLYSSGMPAEALRIAQNGLAIEPQNEARLCEVAAASAFALNDRGQAETLWKRALRLNPGEAGPHYHLGILLADSGRSAEAERCFRRAAEIQPRFAAAHFCLGRCLADADPNAAEECFRRALALDAKLAPAHFLLGLLLFRAGRIDGAEKCYRRAVALDGKFAEAFSNLGDLLSQTERQAEAEECFRRAILIDPEFADARYNLGNLLSDLGKESEAEKCYRDAIALNPGYAQAHMNLGALLGRQGRYGAAEAVCREALEQGVQEARLLSLLVYASSYTASWQRLEEDLARLCRHLGQPDARAVEPFHLLAAPGITPLDQRRQARRYAEETAKANVAGAPLARTGRGERRDRLRIGYLSAHFYDHAVAGVLAGVLEGHDPGKFALYGYSYGPDIADDVRRRVQGACGVFRDLRPLTDAAAAHRIAADEIDILVDLVGYTRDCRPAISALRPAPVVVNWLGYAGTLGHPRLADYIIGDPVVTPLAHAGHFSETLALMPHCYLPFDRRRSVGGRPSRQAAGLPEDGVVFCSFHQCYKLNPQVFALWCRLLSDVRHSVLWLQDPGEAAVANLCREAAARGVDPGRLIFAGRVKSVAEHLGRLQLADLALDTHPYTSHSSGADLLWAGVPMLTKIGETFASRVAASLLHSVGMPELVMEDDEGYFAFARRLALDPEMRGAVRGKLEAARSTAPLFDTARFTRDLEELYRSIWQQTRDGKPAAGAMRGPGAVPGGPGS